MPLDELVILLAQEIDELTAKVVEKEEKFEALFKENSRYLSDLKSGTEEMVTLLHTTRDAQVSVLDVGFILIQNLESAELECLIFIYTSKTPSLLIAIFTLIFEIPMFQERMG